MTFEPRRNYRCYLPDGKHIDYCVQMRTSQYVYLHDGVGKQFRRRVFTKNGVEFCYPFPRFVTESSPVLLASNLVERKATSHA